MFFKFGGASVKDAESVKNVVNVLKQVGHEQTLLVVSAMGKTTNKLELVIKNYFENKSALKSSIQDIKDCHLEIISGLFANKSNPIFNKVKGLFEELEGFLDRNKSPNYSFVYDQVVSFGELLSTAIVSAYLNEVGINSNWIDVREYIKTDSNYRDAKVNWKLTQSNISKKN